jgi:hypothetical protein
LVEKQLVLIEKNAAQQARDMRGATSVAQEAAKAAQRSAEVAESTLILNDRPWVAVTIDLVGPLMFDADGCGVDLKIAFKNVGRSPAVQLGHYFDFCASIDATVDSDARMVKSAEKMLASTSFGETLFPNEVRELEIRETISREKLDAAIKANESKLADLHVLCLAYYGLPTGGWFRYTAVIRALVPKGGDIEGFDGKEAVYPPDTLHLSRTTLGRVT